MCSILIILLKDCGILKNLKQRFFQKLSRLLPQHPLQKTLH
ncbi:hypothetical protein T07_14929 [Trichinella nelsoni]|uniref:Uncharacterized protein n=1 Tax=Trichinella nelsoni TaxID=6336 RepID=A0A0V0RBR1_9BILA|nr:hypothetical protein T07_14929 [Trichinella nelsoni]